MKNKDFVYTGQNNLEAVQEAVNYNDFQRDFLLGQIGEIGKKTVKVLDFGAGIGTYADMIKSKNVHIDCLEPDAKQAKILKQKGYTNYTSIGQVKQKYDVIYALNVFEHIEKDSEVLAELKPLLTKGGRIVIYVPAFKMLWSRMDDLV
ncbi:MAG: class I SAM-dependent methyltransferase [Candidatus Saccharibacteria bacterium]